MPGPSPYLPSLIAAASVLAAGAFGAAAEEERWKALFEDTAEVRVVNVEVFVSDAEGRPVTGLGKDDFELFENAQPVEISNFFAMQGGRRPADAAPEAGAPPVRDLRLVLFVDNSNISAAHRKKVFHRVRELVLEHRRPDVRMMVVTRERTAVGRPLVVRQGFTSVAHEVFVALDEIESLGAEANRWELDRRRLASAIDTINVEMGSDFLGTKGDEEDVTTVAAEARRLLLDIRAYSEERLGALRRTLDTLNQTVDVLAGLPGRKALVYVSDGLPLRPGSELLEGYADRVLAVPALAAEVSPAEAERFDATRHVVEMVDRANAAQVTFYALDGSAPNRVTRRAAESAGASRARGIAATAENGQDSLRLMADSTGGRAGLTLSAFAATLAGILTDFDHFYSIGYTVEPADDLETRRSIEVKVRDPELRVRYRHSFRLKSPEEQAEQRVLSFLLTGDAARSADRPENPLEIVPRTPQVTPRDDGNFVVPVLVEVPLGKLVLVPGKSDHRARVSMVVAARDAQGRTSKVMRHLCPVRIPNSEMLVALGRTMVCGVRLAMRGGRQWVAVAVRDETVGLESIVRFELDVPDGIRTADAGASR